jgi:hypothetical protein
MIYIVHAERSEYFIPGQRLSPCRYLTVSVGQPDAGNLAHVRFHCFADVLFLFPVWSSLLLGSNLSFRQSDVFLSCRGYLFFSV